MTDPLNIVFEDFNINK